MRLKNMLLAVLMLFASAGVFAQGSETYGSGLKLNVKPDGSSYVRFIIWNQIWARAIQNNPGTMVNGTPADVTYDIGIRRARMLAYAQISPRYMILTHFGINNQTFTNGGVPNGGVTGNGGTYTSGKKPGLFFHDVWNEYAIRPMKDPETGELNKFNLYAGFGLHYWHGLSRMTSASTLNFLMIDAPIFNWPTIELSDQFARQFGMYVKGEVGRLSYRANLNKPFTTLSAPPTAAGAKVLDVAVDNNTPNKWATAGYAFWQFFDKESVVLPFTVGTYVGTKKVLNVGAGFYRAPQGTNSNRLNAPGDTTLARHDINLFAVDLFADMPLGSAKKFAITAYSVFYSHNWGPNYYRTVGIMNEGAVDPNYAGTRSQTGAGNARPLLGTGTIWYTQAGLLLPKNWLTSKVRFQPFASYTRHDLDAIQGVAHSYDAGMNCFLDGHHAKITLQYSARPIILNNQPDGHRGEFLLQTQIFL